ncbi:MAG: FKBP-type peptidyl-prolyl cis-trans isomerase [Muribaculaceae bacterium]
MKKLLAFIAAGIALMCSCADDDKTTWEEYTEWRDLNSAWLEEMQQRKNADGTPYYTTVVPDWNPGSFVLMHYFNDRAETEGRLSPLYNSTVDVRYRLHLCDGTGIDSSDNQTQYGAKGIFRTALNNTIQGWCVALPRMRCGDSAEVIVPYGLGYGASTSGNIKPYSTLRFNIRLVDIPFYERPEQ